MPPTGERKYNGNFTRYLHVSKGKNASVLLDRLAEDPSTAAAVASVFEKLGTLAVFAKCGRSNAKIDQACYSRVLGKLATKYAAPVEGSLAFKLKAMKMKTAVDKEIAGLKRMIMNPSEVHSKHCARIRDRLSIFFH